MGLRFRGAPTDYTGNPSRAFSAKELVLAQQPDGQGDFREMFRTSADGSVR